MTRHFSFPDNYNCSSECLDLKKVLEFHWFCFIIVFFCFQAKNWPKRTGIFEEAQWCRSWWQVSLSTVVQAFLPQTTSLSGIWATQVRWQMFGVLIKK